MRAVSPWLLAGQTLCHFMDLHVHLRRHDSEAAKERMHRVIERYQKRPTPATLKPPGASSERYQKRPTPATLKPPGASRSRKPLLLSIFLARHAAQVQGR